MIACSYLNYKRTCREAVDAKGPQSIAQLWGVTKVLRPVQHTSSKGGGGGQYWCTGTHPCKKILD